MVASKDTAVLDSHEVKDSPTARKYLEMGKAAEDRGERIKAIEAYEAAFAADPDNTDVCFHLAINLDLVGEEDEALHLYEECVHRPNPPLNALLNLAILYEDRGQYAQAERCVRQVLSTDPNHARARLYIKDILASKAMMIEDEETRLHKGDTTLDTPVTDFDLTVRTRNCLRKMNIRTLADLLRVTEAEMRSYKNLGESSIDEIKAMLAQRGLKLGQSIEESQSAAKQAVYDQLKDDQGDAGQLVQSVNDLNLSVRARKALALLGITSVGDLCMRTEAELMGVKNFGMTSLLEIKEKLADLGLGLRKLEEEEGAQAE
ncbi:MAG: tetratricopeptide repeat protein [Phycisphaera sp.]|nr:tetratricopeptide repeat protein [Phycisphaera sp.]